MTPRVTRAHAFGRVRAIGATLPGVESMIRYDGSPVLKLNGSFMAGLATHPSTGPDTLVVRVDLQEREYLLDDAPETYYLTDYYRPHPVVLVRLARIDDDALRDLLAMSSRVTGSRRRRAAARPAHKSAVIARRRVQSLRD